MAYVDFAINDTGDLLFTKRDDKYKPFNIKFNIAKTKVQKISFLTSPFEETHHKSNDYLKVSFIIEDIENKTTSLVYKDTDVLTQLIAIQLNGTVGELPYRTDDGSKLSTYKHQNINKDFLSNLESYLTSFLSGYISSPVVKANANINYNNGYKQAVDIYIYNNSDLLLKHTLES